jgi:1-acyl-sn-glycerol-3-phosphate acyltransferase
MNERRKPLLSVLCRRLLEALGWEIIVEDPGVEKYVLVVAPHTSNWDFPLGILAAKALDLRPRWIGKHTLFNMPFGWLFRALGGIPVNRGAPGDLVRQMTRYFADADRLVLGLAPEGTRGRADHWKSGFYHIARAARVPIVMAYLDYGKRQVGMGGAFMPGNNRADDFERMRRFYEDRRGKYPAKESPVRERQSR